jgi:hypothetical protein
MIMELLSCMLRRTNKKTNLPTMKIIQPKDTKIFSPQLPPKKNNSKNDLVKYHISWIL